MKKELLLQFLELLVQADFYYEKYINGKTAEFCPSLKNSEAAIEDSHRFVSNTRNHLSSFDTTKK